MMDVLVIGAGAAGVAAMRKLHDAGLKVLGLEAADRIGGRIHTVKFGANTADLGATWSIGQKDNIVHELATPLDLIETCQPDYKQYLLSNGELIPDATANDVVDALNQEVAQADKYTTKSISECIRNASVTNETLKNDPKLTESFYDWYEKANHLGGDNDPRHGKSLRSLVEYWKCEGAWQTWKGRGYTTILDLLTNKYPDPSKEVPLQILLNKEVENIRWGTSQESGNSLVQVVCKDGSLYAAKSVIVTVSVGVLKDRHGQLFTPPLPVDKINTIKNLQLCSLSKIYIEFEKPWWAKVPANIILLWHDEDRAKFSEDEKWITQIYGLISMDRQPDVLLAWLTGNGSKWMEQVSEEKVREGIQKLLDNVVKKQFNVTPIKSILRTQWTRDPLTQCAYAHRSVALEEQGGGAIVLSEPLYHGNKFPVVCFAGEATSHHRHHDVQGAVESGYREADRLIESFRKLDK